MQNNKLILIASALFLTLESFGVVQAQGGNPQGEEKQRGFRVSLFNQWGGPQLYYKGKKDYVSLTAYKKSYTKRLPYAKDQPVVLYTKVERNEEVLYEPYFTTKIPSEVIEPLLVLYWNAQSKKGGAQVLEFSPRRFPYGSFQIVNVGKTPIVGYIEKKSNRFSCLSQKPYINSSKIKDGEVIPVEMFTKINDKPEVVYSASIKYRESKRMVIFLYPHAKRKDRIVYRAQMLEDYKQQVQ